MHQNEQWLFTRFSELRRMKPDATIFDGFIYATVCLYRDLEPGEAEGAFNVYEALLAPDLKAYSERLGRNRTTVWRWLRDFQIRDDNVEAVA